MEQFINSYYENNAKKLHAVINKIFSKNHGGTIGRDMEEFYGIGTDVLVGIWDKYRLGQSTYDPFKGDLDGYVYNALSMAIIDELKKQNCDKRTTKVYLLDGNGNPVLDKKTGKPVKVPIPDIRLDAPMKEDSDITWGDLIEADFDINAKAGIGITEEYSYEMKIYLGKLSKLQVKVLKLLSENYKPDEIKKILHIGPGLYNDCISAIKSFKNTKCIASLIRRDQGC